MTERKQMIYDDWVKKGAELFGDKRRNWKFVCPKCGTVQTGQDFLDNGIAEDTAVRQIGYSCIGRSVKGMGCDWTLGGLFQTHTMEIMMNDKLLPVFEFAKGGE